MIVRVFPEIRLSAWECDKVALTAVFSFLSDTEYVPHHLVNEERQENESHSPNYEEDSRSYVEEHIEGATFVHSTVLRLSSPIRVEPEE